MFCGAILKRRVSNFARHAPRKNDASLESRSVRETIFLPLLRVVLTITTNGTDSIRIDRRPSEKSRQSQDCGAKIMRAGVTATRASVHQLRRYAFLRFLDKRIRSKPRRVHANFSRFSRRLRGARGRRVVRFAQLFFFPRSPRLSTRN